MRLRPAVRVHHVTLLHLQRFFGARQRPRPSRDLIARDQGLLFAGDRSYLEEGLDLLSIEASVTRFGTAHILQQTLSMRRDGIVNVVSGHRS